MILRVLPPTARLCLAAVLSILCVASSISAQSTSAAAPPSRAAASRLKAHAQPQFSSSATITTFAGDHNNPGVGGDGGPATSAGLSAPMGIVFDSKGNGYTTDGDSIYGDVRKIDASTGVITTIAGLPSGSSLPTCTPYPTCYNGGPAIGASMSPGFLAVDASDNLYIADADYSVIWKLDVKTQTIAVIAGIGACNQEGPCYSGDGGPATQAQLYDPQGMAFDAAGNLYFADSDNDVIRVINAGTGIIETLPGSGNDTLFEPEGLAFDAAGNLIVADNEGVHKYDAGSQSFSTVLGHGNGCTQQTDIYGDGCLANEATVGAPVGLAIDDTGTIFFADYPLDVLRVIDATTGIVTVAAGTVGSGGYAGDGGPASEALLYFPYQISWDASGNLYIADELNSVVREIHYASGSKPTAAKPTFSPAPGAYVNPVSVVISDTTPGATIYYTLDGSTPTTSSPQYGGPISITDTTTINALATASGYNASAVATAAYSISTKTNTTLTSSANPAAAGATVIFTAQVQPHPGMVGPLEEVDFIFDGSSGVTGSLQTNGTASVFINGLTIGTHSVVAYYHGDDNYTSSTSNTLTETITSAPPNPTLLPASIVFPATAVGSTSASQTVTLSNPGSTALTITSFTFAGTNASEFTIVSKTCGASLAAGGSCTVTLAFKPTASGTASTTFSAADSAVGSPPNVPQTVSLIGSTPGTTIAFSPSSITFPATAVGSTSTNETVTLTNASPTALTISSFSFAGASAGEFVIVGKTCGTSLAVGASCTLTLAFKPTAAGAATATLNARDNASNSPQTLALSGTTASTSTASFSPASVTFPDTVVGASSNETITFSNNGTDPITVSSFSFTGPNAAEFQIVDKTCNTQLYAGDYCTITVAFHPTATGTASAAFQAIDNATNSPQKAVLSGSAPSAIKASFSPTTLTFPTTPVGATSTNETVTFTNTGSASMTVSSFKFSGTNAAEFIISTKTCGTSLAAGASCTLALAFKPLVAGAASATLTATDNATNSPQSVALTASTPIDAAFSPTSLTFPATAVGSTSASQTVTFSNPGYAAISVNSFKFTGANAAEFSIVGKTCNTSLAAGVSCTLTLAFKPTATGSATATLTATDNATNSPQSIAFTGSTPTASTAAFSPTSVTFPSTAVGSTSTNETVTFKNTGTNPMAVSSFKFTGGNASEFVISTKTCGTSLAAGASCTLTLAFKPTAAGAASTTFQATDNATNSPQSIAITATTH